MKNTPFDLSIIIPARNEIFLARTIQDLLENISGNTEIIIGLDGDWANPPIPVHERVSVIRYQDPIGQRALCNRMAEMSKAKYLMKVDAHCAFDKGFDAVLLKDMQPDWTLLPTMKNLHAFNWVCEKGHKRYQGGAGPCLECEAPTKMDVIWYPKPSPNSTAFLFDNTLHFQYWGAYKKKQKGDLVETMSIQGSCFMVTRDKWLELEFCDEGHGSWGQQGVEVACKTWLSGGRVICSRKTWYAHLFRTQSGFGHPYPNPGIQKARDYSRNLWLGDNWPLAIHPLSWLLEKFGPVPGWDVSTGILYYTDNRLDEYIMAKCQHQIKKSVGNNRLVSVSLQPIVFGDNITIPFDRGPLTMFRQILIGLEELDTDIIFFTEHDVLYHPSHFDFVPPEKDKFYYNTNVWKVWEEDGHAVRTDFCQQTSGLCAYRELLVKHYKKRVELVEQNGYSAEMGYEPGTHGRNGRVDDYESESWESEFPNIDIRHLDNLTTSRRDKEQYRNKKFTEGWLEADEVPGWGVTKGRFEELLIAIR